ncbi:MAG: hypothetical protein ACRDMV_04445, partial [Streptosporangiales bacterium]
MARSSDLAPLLHRRSQDLGLRQGVVVAWDSDAGTNQIQLGNTVLSNLPIAGDFTPAVGDIVGLVRSRSTWFVNGPYGAPSSGPVALVSSV